MTYTFHELSLWMDERRIWRWDLCVNDVGDKLVYLKDEKILAVFTLFVCVSERLVVVH